MRARQRDALGEGEGEKQQDREQAGQGLLPGEVEQLAEEEGGGRVVPLPARCGYVSGSECLTFGPRQGRRKDILSHFLHLLGSYPLLIGFFAQVVVLIGALKSKEKPIIVQTLVLMGALGLVMTAILLRPKSPPNLMADLFGCAGAAFLLAPAVEALRKQWQAKKEANGEAKG